MVENQIVIAEKVCHKGRIHASTSSGGAIIPLNQHIALKFIANNEAYVTIQVLMSGIETTIKSQQWQKTRIIKEPAKPKEKKEKEEKEQVTLPELGKSEVW